MADWSVITHANRCCIPSLLHTDYWLITHSLVHQALVLLHLSNIHSTLTHSHLWPHSSSNRLNCLQIVKMPTEFFTSLSPVGIRENRWELQFGPSNLINVWNVPWRLANLVIIYALVWWSIDTRSCSDEGHMSSPLLLYRGYALI